MPSLGDQQRKEVKVLDILAFIVMMIAAIGCETIVEVELPNQAPALVVNSLFGPDSTWEVRLLKSKSSLSRIIHQPVVIASVEILDGSSAVVASLSHVGGGVYRSSLDLKPIAGERYGLRASAPGFATVEAWDSVPLPVAVAGVDVDASTVPFKLTVRFTDPPASKNYYQILVLTPEFDGSNRLLPVWIESDDLIFQDIGGISQYDVYFDDSLISGQSYSLKLRIYPWQTDPLRQIYVVLLSVTESYYKYMRSVITQEDNGANPFSTPVQIHNNIENGLGIFAGYSFMRVPVFAEPPKDKP